LAAVLRDKLCNLHFMALLSRLSTLYATTLKLFAELPSRKASKTEFVPLSLTVYMFDTGIYTFIPFQIKTIYIESIADMERALQGKVFDAVCAFGSMHHAPREFIQKQVRLLRDHLAPGGLWVQLAYPINRFRNPRSADNLPQMQAAFYGDGLSFNNGGWGGDNDKTPWAEW
jgi:hypothetical protein